MHSAHCRPAGTAEIVVIIDLLPTQPVGNVMNAVAVSSSSFDPNSSNNRDEAVTRVTRGGGSIPITGAQIAATSAVAAMLLVGGWLLAIIARRRRSDLT